MSTTTAAAPNSPAKSRKDREREKEKEKALLAAERLKTVVRRLPPNLPEDVFWKSVEPWVTEETVTWKVYYKGKFRSRLNKENMPSRAYIAFKSPEQIATFSKSYDGHMFRDKAGNESFAVVEYAPYQKVPTEKKKPDARNATIETDEDYISFLATLKATAEPVSLETLIASSQPAPQPKTTPLLEALKAEKTASKDKEAILRNHAHYKGQAGQAARAKEEAKKKGSASQNKPSESGPFGKKGPKKPANTNGNVNATTSNDPKAPASTPGGGGSSKPKPAKPPRAARVQHSKPEGSTPTPEAAPTILTSAAVQTPSTATSTTTAPTNSSAASSSTAPAAADASAPLAGPRRGRPVIGIASRHFEAALSGAGVRGSGTIAGGVRGPRQGGEIQVDGDGSIGGTDGTRKEPPTSPRRDRRRREGGGVAGTQSGGAAGTGNAEPPKVPSILQRVDAPPSRVVNVADGDPPAPTQGQVPSQGGGRGGRRGRGRGRGGAPARGG